MHLQDDPFDPMDLSTNFICPGSGNVVDQLACSFQVEFKDTSQFDLFVKVEHQKNPDRTAGGRNFLWAFNSAWIKYGPQHD